MGEDPRIVSIIMSRLTLSAAIRPIILCPDSSPDNLLDRVECYKHRHAPIHGWKTWPEGGLGRESSPRRVCTGCARQPGASAARSRRMLYPRFRSPAPDLWVPRTRRRSDATQTCSDAELCCKVTNTNLRHRVQGTGPSSTHHYRP